MPEVRLSLQACACLAVGYLFLAGCGVPTLFSYLIFENPVAFVRLEVSPWVDPERPETLNSHPATLSRRQMIEALEGLQVREHRSAPIRWFRGVAELEPAFDDHTIELLAPKLLEGLELAVPQELVTYYVSHPINATKREVTSGGVYVKDGHIHIIISNHRTNFEIPPAGLIYDRRYPLFSLTPLGIDLWHEAEDTVVVQHQDFWDELFGDEHSGKIVLDLSRLAMMTL